MSDGRSAPAAGRRRQVLIVEDEWLILDRIQHVLAGTAFEPAGAAASVAAALRLLEATRFDAAILDYNLAGEGSDEVALRLTGQAVPFILLTGYGSTLGSSAFAGAPVLAKPFEAHALRALLSSLKFRAST